MSSSSFNNALFIKICENARVVDINKIVRAGLISNTIRKNIINSKFVIVSTGRVNVRMKLNLIICKPFIENLLIMRKT